MDLSASLTFEANKVHIRSQGQLLGQWPLEEFGAERGEANRFSLVVGGELWTFDAEQPADFLASSLEARAGQSSRDRFRRPFHRLRSAGITVGAFSLAVATILTTFAGGILVGRYGLERNGAVVAAAVVIAILFSLIRVGASRRLTPPPSVAARALDRDPARVTRLAPRRDPVSRTERSSAALPGPLNREEEPSPPPGPGLTRIQYAGHSHAPTTGRDQSDGSQEEEEEEAETADTLPADDAQDLDMDLTTIKGIGPALAKRLHKLGVRDVVDLAHLDDRGVEVVVRRLGRFGKRLIQEDWIGQAQRRLEVD